MKKIIVTFLLSTFAIISFAQNAWTVEHIPNTRKQSNYIHVSDPDGYLSAETEMKINTALNAIRDQVDVFLVTLNSIGDYAVPKDFAIDLFSYWGIGDKGKDNGLLLLFVEDQHAFEFETGYGIEPILTDAKCFEIFNHTIKPYFKNGDYEGGMYAGVLDIVDVFGGTVPDNLITDLPDDETYQQAITERDKVTESEFFMVVMVFFLLIIPGISLLRYAMGMKKDKKANKNGEIKDSFSIDERNGLKYINEASTSWSGSAWEGQGCLKVINFGLSALLWLAVATRVIKLLISSPDDEYTANNVIAFFTIFLYYTWVCVSHNIRTLKMADKVAKSSMRPKMVYDKAKSYARTKYVNLMAFWIGWYFKKKYDERKEKCEDMLCPDCHQPMDFDASVRLSDIEAAENANDSIQYTSLRCPSGHVYVLKENGRSYKAYTDCEKCGAHLFKTGRTVELERPTYTHSGLQETEYECEFCHYKTVKKAVIPKLVRTTTTTVGGFGGGGSSRSSGGSFGGGRSGGGGYSGRW